MIEIEIGVNASTRQDVDVDGERPSPQPRGEARRQKSASQKIGRHCAAARSAHAPLILGPCRPEEVLDQESQDGDDVLQQAASVLFNQDDQVGAACCHQHAAPAEHFLWHMAAIVWPAHRAHWLACGGDGHRQHVDAANK